MNNQILYDKRNEAVKSAFVALSIEEYRRSTKGFGESIAIDNNSTPEGKVNNRRVEFVKM